MINHNEYFLRLEINFRKLWNARSGHWSCCDSMCDRPKVRVFSIKCYISTFDVLETVLLVQRFGNEFQIGKRFQYSIHFADTTFVKDVRAFTTVPARGMTELLESCQTKHFCEHPGPIQIESSSLVGLPFLSLLQSERTACAQ